MATSQQIDMNLSTRWNVAKDAGDGRSVVDDNSLTSLKNFPYGIGDGECDLLWRDRRTVADVTNDDLVLGNGSLIDAFGDAITFAFIKVIIIKNLNTVSGENLQVGGALNDFSSWLGASGQSLLLGAGSPLYLHHEFGYAVTAGTGDVLRFRGSGASITYDVILGGTSA